MKDNNKNKKKDQQSKMLLDSRDASMATIIILEETSELQMVPLSEVGVFVWVHEHTLKKEKKRVLCAE